MRLRARARSYGAAALLFAQAGLAGCGHGGASAEGQATPPPPAVVVMTVKSQTVPIRQDFVGSTGAVEQVDIRARVKGVLEQVNFKEGGLVKAGQVLFVIQKEQYEASVQAAQANVLKAKAGLYQAQQSVPVLQALATVAQNRAKVAQAQLDVHRLSPLAQVHAVPQQDLDNAVTNLAVAQANLEASLANLRDTQVNKTASVDSAQAQLLSAQADLTNAKLNLSYCTITSPVTGVIGFLKFDVGNVVGDADSQILDTVSTIDPIKVLFSADEGTYLELADKTETYHGVPLRDQPVTLVLSNNKSFPYTGSLYTVNRALDTQTGTITVEARFPNPDGYLRPGQFGRIRVVTQELPNALLVPQLAVVQTQGANNAYVVGSDGIVQLRSLSLGPQIGNDFVVLSGLRAGDRVIVQGTQKAVPGQKVVASTASGA